MNAGAADAAAGADGSAPPPILLLAYRRPDTTARVLERLPVLHHQLVDLAEASPSRCPFEPDDRAELL